MTIFYHEDSFMYYYPPEYFIVFVFFRHPITGFRVAWSGARMEMSATQFKRTLKEEYYSPLYRFWGFQNRRNKTFKSSTNSSSMVKDNWLTECVDFDSI